MKSQFACSGFILSLLTISLQAQSTDALFGSIGRMPIADFDQSERLLLAKLSQRHDFNLVDTTLEDFAKLLRSNGVPTYLAARELEESGIRPDHRLTIQQTSLRLIDSLQLILKEHGLSWLIKNERLIITSDDNAGMHLVTKCYDVRNLVEFAPAQSTYDGIGGFDFDSLIELITQTIEADSWSDVGGMGAIEPYSTRRMRILVVSQTYPVHLEIRDLLSRLGQLGGFTPLEIPAVSPTIPPSDRGRTLGIRSSNLRMSGRLSNGH